MPNAGPATSKSTTTSTKVDKNSRNMPNNNGEPKVEDYPSSILDINKGSNTCNESR